ncbi:unnamed protein product [Rotaria sp. Silwood1]|nr:unnamed protein product [Rotaria sp. Silwood1]CAF1638752.1 unnamed protein product [Rotaria sp. Silwood1]CAF3775901.1 unnamed protein product [Rotaria sp. Silwood1]CAF3802913.1 unnamed protein product [Rotaria sp. Silwood1]CAF3828926.1 unnamed protein product [Rotaria sp. Silwood1]
MFMAATSFSSLDDNISQSPTVSYIQSQKGKLLLVLDKCIFKLNKTTTTTKYWICTCIECSMKVHTNMNDQLVKVIGEHCHPTEQELIHVRELRAKVKQRAIDETTPIPRIYDEECARAMLSDTVIALLPSEREINSAVNKARRAVTPTIPTTQLFDLPDFYTKTLRNNDFLIADKFINRRQRIILFGSHEQLKMLFSAEVILMDGTFSACPTIFDQIYTIHCIKYKQSFPCVFGLLPNRYKNTYSFLFHELKYVASQMKLDFSPKIIMSDFEPGLAGAVKSEFSTVKHSSCYFHFTQAIYRNIQHLGLSSMYNDDDNVKSFCRKLMALPLLPETVIEDAYDDLVGKLAPDMRTVINDLLEYFQGQWFLKVPISQWCVHGSCIRTNNNAEAFHSRFNRRVQIHHPNIWSFIKFLQAEESRFYHMHIQFCSGLGTRTQKAKTIAIQHRIENLTERYNDGLINVMEYLDGLSLVVAKKKK